MPLSTKGKQKPENQRDQRASSRHGLPQLLQAHDSHGLNRHRLADWAMAALAASTFRQTARTNVVEVPGHSLHAGDGRNGRVRTIRVPRCVQRLSNRRHTGSDAGLHRRRGWGSTANCTATRHIVSVLGSDGWLGQRTSPGKSIRQAPSE